MSEKLRRFRDRFAHKPAIGGERIMPTRSFRRLLALMVVCEAIAELAALIAGASAGWQAGAGAGAAMVAFLAGWLVLEPRERL